MLTLARRWHLAKRCEAFREYARHYFISRRLAAGRHLAAEPSKFQLCDIVRRSGTSMCTCTCMYVRAFVCACVCERHYVLTYTHARRRSTRRATSRYYSEQHPHSLTRSLATPLTVAEGMRQSYRLPRRYERWTDLLRSVHRHFIRESIQSALRIQNAARSMCRLYSRSHDRRSNKAKGETSFLESWKIEEAPSEALGAFLWCIYHMSLCLSYYRSFEKSRFFAPRYSPARFRGGAVNRISRHSRDSHFRLRSNQLNQTYRLDIGASGGANRALRAIGRAESAQPSLLHSSSQSPSFLKEPSCDGAGHGGIYET
jgi:hypothetical protein